jgi:hypothetical protein
MYLAAQPLTYAAPATRRCRQMGNYPWRARRSLLGALTPDEAAQTAMPLSTIRNTPGFQQSVYNYLVSSAQTGQMTAPLPTSCAGGTSNVSFKPAILSVAGGVALKLAPATGPAAPFVALGGALAGLFGAIFGKHAAAVAKEQQVICASVPAANDSLLAIDQAVQNGTITPQTGQAALTQLVSEFSQNVASIIKMSPSQCNAACVWTKMLKAIVAEKQSQYQDLIAQQAAQAAAAAAQQAAATAAAQQTVQQIATNPVQAITSAASSVLAPVETAATQVSTSTGIPTWALYGAAGFLLYKLFSS